MNFLRKTLLPVLGLILFSCAHKANFKDLNAWNEAVDGSVQLSVRTVKKKKNKVDLIVIVKNQYKFTVVISEGSLRYEANGDPGVSSPNPRRILKTGDIVSFSMKYTLAEREDGFGTLKLENIYSGKEIEVSGANSNQHTTAIGGVVGGGHVAVAMGQKNTTANVEGYQKKSAIEDQLLPSISLEIPD